MENIEEYKIIFFEIINGFTPAFHSVFNNIFIKHLSYIELAQFDVKYKEYLNEAKSFGILTYKEKENQIIKDGLWTENDEIDLEINDKIIKDLKINYSKDYLHSRRQSLKKEIESFQNKIEALRLKKSYYIGQTAEVFAGKKTLYYKIINSFFINKECTNILVNNDDIDDEKYTELEKLYYLHLEKINVDNLKKIALSPFFTNIYYLCEDNAYSFYGKPVVQLSNYQCDLVGFARYFRNILSNRNDIPNEIKNNPNELMEWVEIRKNAETAGIIGENEASDGSKSILGATKADLNILGVKTEERFSLRKELDKAGGTLDASKLFELTR